MRRIISLLLSAVLLLSLLSACRGPVTESMPTGAPSEEPLNQPTALEVVNAVFPSCGFDQVSADVEYLTAEGDREFLTAYLENAYGLPAGEWEDAAVIRATGASAFELAVLRLADEDAAVRAASALMSYIFARQGDFAGYAPAEADMAANGSIIQSGPYAALFICPDTDRADAAFQAAVKGGVLPAQSGGGPQLEPEVGAILDFLLEQCDGAADGLERLDASNPDALASYIGTAYGLEQGQWEEAAIARGGGESVFEIAVLRVKDEGLSRTVMEALNGYLDTREEMGEFPADQFALVYDAAAFEVWMESGEIFVILPICENSENLILNVLASALQAGTIGRIERHQNFMPAGPEYDHDYPDRIKFVQPDQDDMSLYDTTAIRAAWEAEDPSGLSGYDRDIYEAAQEVLNKVLKKDMGDLEKETAIYKWVVNSVDYDWTHQDIMVTTPRESFTPYGGLVNRTAVCLGYATTFQLLCDLAGVECITVVGAAFSSSEDHGWNMVRLNGNWYCVDATWDANYREQGVSKGREKDWDYFNVTSDDMAASNHQWDYANTPEAVTEGNGRE